MGTVVAIISIVDARGRDFGANNSGNSAPKAKGTVERGPEVSAAAARQLRRPRRRTTRASRAPNVQLGSGAERPSRCGSGARYASTVRSFVDGPDGNPQVSRRPGARKPPSACDSVQFGVRARTIFHPKITSTNGIRTARFALFEFSPRLQTQRRPMKIPESFPISPRWPSPPPCYATVSQVTSVPCKSTCPPISAVTIPIGNAVET